MPHYANGKEAKPGDLVKVTSPGGAQRVIGIVIHVMANAESCNAQIIALARQWSDGPLYPANAQYAECVTLKECLPLIEETAAPAEAT
jgi:hypothetical protein